MKIFFVFAATIAAAASAAGAVNVPASVFQSCAKACINNAVFPDCASPSPDVETLKTQLSDSKKEIAAIKADHLTAAQCNTKVATEKQAATAACDTKNTAAAGAASADIAALRSQLADSKKELAAIKADHLTAAQCDAKITTANPAKTDPTIKVLPFTKAECDRKRIIYMASAITTKAFTMGDSFDCKVDSRRGFSKDPAPGKLKSCWILGQFNRWTEGTMNIPMPYNALVFFGADSRPNVLTEQEATGKMAIRCGRDRFSTPAETWYNQDKGNLSCFDSNGRFLAKENTIFNIPDSFRLMDGCD
ncbi:MAG: hypothetical protein LBL46_04045 [Rickettsiales bacterium]|jgi:hypothetical protein|nr:hypothetical protein [Rickettsiales bacterium]